MLCVLFVAVCCDVTKYSTYALRISARRMSAPKRQRYAELVWSGIVSEVGRVDAVAI